MKQAGVKYYDEFLAEYFSTDREYAPLQVEVTEAVCRYGKEEHRVFLFKNFKARDKLRRSGPELQVSLWDRYANFSNSSESLRLEVEALLMQRFQESEVLLRLPQLESEIGPIVCGFDFVSDDSVQLMAEALEQKYFFTDGLPRLDRISLEPLLKLLEALLGPAKNKLHVQQLREFLLSSVLSCLEKYDVLPEDIMLLSLFQSADQTQTRLSKELLKTIGEIARTGTKQLMENFVDRAQKDYDDPDGSLALKAFQLPSLSALTILMLSDLPRAKALISDPSDFPQLQTNFPSYGGLLAFLRLTVGNPGSIQVNKASEAWEELVKYNLSPIFLAPIVWTCHRLWNSTTNLLPLRMYMVGHLLALGMPLGDPETQTIVELALHRAAHPDRTRTH